MCLIRELLGEKNIQNRHFWSFTEEALKKISGKALLDNYSVMTHPHLLRGEEEEIV